AVMVAPAIFAEIIVASLGRGVMNSRVPEKLKKMESARGEGASSPQPSPPEEERERLSQTHYKAGPRSTAAPNRSSGKRGGWRAAAVEVTCWGAAAGLVFLVIAFAWGNGSLESSWKSHTAAHQISGLSSPDDFRFEPV